MDGRAARKLLPRRTTELRSGHRCSRRNEGCCSGLEMMRWTSMSATFRYCMELFAMGSEVNERSAIWSSVGAKEDSNPHRV